MTVAGGSTEPARIRIGRKLAQGPNVLARLAIALECIDFCRELVLPIGMLLTDFAAVCHAISPRLH